jgi:uncharacterized protein (DUF2235 family)
VPGKSIFLLADGTGNAAASPFKTNVWRLYQAIDQTQPDQIAFYIDGVGTETFKPLRALGGAFGIGVAKNVKQLYQFLCRNYDQGDRIFLFGFSRGAFTTRLLGGLIMRCGVVKAPNEHLLTDYVEHAYAQYKLDAARRATATRWQILGLLLRLPEAWARLRSWIMRRPAPQLPPGPLRFPRIQVQIYPPIQFIGVWDTVDAYGMPIDEIKMAIDKWFWPMTLADRNFADGIHRACHAISLDDERPTFRPVLWTDPSTRPERLSQVWFAGVHANVGGGYPDDGLAHVALQWIMEEAQVSTGRLLPLQRTEVDTRVDAHGRQYDSRAGLAGYYRYGPRDVGELSDDPRHGVSVARPLVHRAAWERIHVRQVAYAPTSFPKIYDLADTPVGGGRLQVTPSIEPPADAEARNNDMELARNVVWRRKLAYYATVYLTAILVALPGYDIVRSGGNWPVDFGRWSEPVSSLLSPMIARWNLFWQTVTTSVQTFGESIMAWSATSAQPQPLKNALAWIGEGLFLPDYWVPPLLTWAHDKKLVPWAAPWLESFARHPTLFLITAIPLLWLFLRKSQLLQSEIFRRAEFAWRRA